MSDVIKQSETDIIKDPFESQFYGEIFLPTESPDLSDQANNVIKGNVIRAVAGYIGGGRGWEITTGLLKSVGLGMATPDGNPTYAYWAGDDTPADAEFSVTHAGIVKASSLEIGGLIEKTITTTDNIQTALDAINTAGGGTLRLSPGTYTVATDLIMYDSTTIQGDSNANTFLDFDSNSKSIKWTGTDIYTTGTVASTSGTTVTGSGTTWTASMVGRHILMDERWYQIVAFVNTTTIIIDSAYQDGASFSGTYRIVNVINNVAIKDVTIKNSGTTALIGIDILDVELEDVVFLDNNKGFDFDNFSRVSASRLSLISNTSNGFELTQGTFFNAVGVASIANGGHGAVLNNIKSCTFVWSAANSNTTDGYNCTDVTNCVFKLEVSSNGSNGIEFVSGCNNNFINDTLCSSNTSDGIKLTGTSDNNTIGSSLNVTDNGAYGINIANANCDNNIILSPLFDNNTSGEYDDSGTDTVIILQEGTGAIKQTAGVSNWSQAAGSGDANYDETITCNFEMQVVKMRYYIQGHTIDSGFQQEEGVVVFAASTLKSHHKTAVEASLGLDDAIPGTASKTKDASALVVGGKTTLGMEITISIEDIGATSFKIRKAIDEGDNALGPARFQITWEAWG